MDGCLFFDFVDIPRKGIPGLQKGTRHQAWVFLKKLDNIATPSCFKERPAFSKQQSLQRSPVPQHIWCAHYWAHNMSMSESMPLLKLELEGLFFLFSYEGEQRWQILLRNCKDISKRHFLSLGHLLRHIVMLICIQIDWNGYMWGESLWLTVSAWRELHERNLDFISSFPPPSLHPK